jgi:hypothetical protein
MKWQHYYSIEGIHFEADQEETPAPERKIWVLGRELRQPQQESNTGRTPSEDLESEASQVNKETDVVDKAVHDQCTGEENVTEEEDGHELEDCLSKPDRRPQHPVLEDTSFKLHTEHVWDGFLIIALLEDHRERNVVLSVPHTGAQKDRFSHALKNHNERVRQCLSTSKPVQYLSIE